MKKWIIAYLLGAAFTNSYIRHYRWDEWVRISVNENNNNVNHASGNCTICTLFATVGWPLYAAVSVTDVIVSTKVNVEKPEILK
jgi:hypothetical protein